MTGAVWYRAGAELRRRAGATIVLAVLAGAVGGFVLAGAAGARRTASAMDRFVAWSQPGTLFLEFEPGTVDEGAVAGLPQVVGTATGSYVLLAPARPDGSPDREAAGTINPFLLLHRSGERSDRLRVIEGRLPAEQEPLEIAVDEELADRRGLAPGNTLRMWGYGPDQLEGAGAAGVADPTGPAMDLVVTAVVRTPGDVVPRAGDPDVVYTGTQDLYLGPAWYARYGPEVAMFGPDGSLEVRLRDGAAGIPAFEEALGRQPDGDAVTIDTVSDAVRAKRASERAISIGAGAIWVFAALGALTGAVIVGQALSRTLQVDADEVPALRALGFGPASLVAVALLRTLATALPAAVVAVALAVALSPLAPIGLARRAEVDPGIDVDLPVLGLGALVLVVLLSIRGGLTGLRLARGAATRRPGRTRPSRVAGRLAEAGAPPPVVAGVRLALQPGRGRSALVSLTAATAVVVAASGFAASLDRLVRSPALQGWNWDVVVGNGQDSSIEDQGGLLEANPHVGAWAPFSDPVDARVAGIDVELEPVGYGDDGVGPTITGGRAPATAQEIALGEETLAEAGAAIGDPVELEVEGERVAMTVVGTALFNDREEEQTKLDSGALVTLDGARRVGIEPFVRHFVVDFAAGADEGEAYGSLQADFGRTVLRPVPAVDVENLRRVGGLPVALAILVGTLALAALAHALVTTLRRRRRDLAVLRTLGFLRRQLGTAVLAFAATTVVVAVAVGAPLGVGLGRWSWRLVADSIGTPAAPVVPVMVVALVLPLTLLVAAGVAALPARSAAKTKPATVLRSE